MKHTETLAPMEELVPLIQEALSAGRTVQLSPRGTSMLPMLRQGIDSVVLSPVPETLRKYDLPLYRRENGKYVLHRIIDVEGIYTCMGDNQFSREPGIRHDQMIAVVTAFYRDGKKYSVSNPGYRLYCRIWYHSRPLRRFWRRGIGWIRRHMK